MDDYIASSHRPWMLESGASSHITCIKDKFISLYFFNQFPSINIVDGTQSPVFGNRVAQVTPSLNLTNMLYVLKFSVSLSSISKFTK